MERLKMKLRAEPLIYSEDISIVMVYFLGDDGIRHMQGYFYLRGGDE